MKWILPWGRLALDEIDDPNKSDDGPIWWIRPGEQSVSCQQGTPIKVREGFDDDLILKSRRISAKLESNERGTLVS